MRLSFLFIAGFLFGILTSSYTQTSLSSYTNNITNTIYVELTEIPSINTLYANLPQDVQTMFQEVEKSLPSEHLSPLERVEVLHGTHQRRGLASFRSIFLGVDSIQSLPEMRRVIIHEFGHVVDLGLLKPTSYEQKSAFNDGPNPVYHTDPSLLFYTLCWNNERTQNNQCEDNDFVSGYAKENVFEDFAETYLLYAENKNSFALMAKTSPILQKKYHFMETIVFKEHSIPDEFFSIDPETRVFDLTKLIGIPNRRP